jgi:hypothetical protein
MANLNIFYVYEHWRLDRDECFYVGKGCRNRAYARDGRNTHWRNIVSKLERIGSGYEVKIVACGMSEKDAIKLEIERIAFWRDLVDLCNKTDGGDGVSGFVMPSEARIKMSEKAKGRPGVKSMLGRKHTEATKEKMRSVKLGKMPNNAGKKYTKKPFTEEHRAKLSQAHIGKVMSAETRAKLSQKTKAQWANPLKRPGRQEKLGV